MYTEFPCLPLHRHSFWDCLCILAHTSGIELLLLMEGYQVASWAVSWEQKSGSYCKPIGFMINIHPSGLSVFRMFTEKAPRPNQSISSMSVCLPVCVLVPSAGHQDQDSWRLAKLRSDLFKGLKKGVWRRKKTGFEFCLGEPAYCVQ